LPWAASSLFLRGGDTPIIVEDWYYFFAARQALGSSTEKSKALSPKPYPSFQWCRCITRSAERRTFDFCCKRFTGSD
jgi:hypothetical protein